VTTADMTKVRTMAAASEYRGDAQSPLWIGVAVAEVLGLDVDEDKKRIKALIKTWLGNGVLKIERRKDAETRHERAFVVPGDMEN